ncbi:hypothetical protein [Leadbetterella byssophila]|uniref:Membrane or secreted protein n=1 Tax=Leadbetterella byssophila (strain DSM 17132 / JCM 16389 / KACC 11308 / NBRC 106382 / 4M15) TaxID=649349 RepID=E4RS14_LEAB4|nr:hypothetical protein [Leadbetterella byssophila]ADQ15830.1 membrane or secreted protein [Leadbetterella byssophila DSM 17132]
MKMFLSLLLSLSCVLGYAQGISGAWHAIDNGVTTQILATEQYISVTEYTPTSFNKTWGGKYEVQKGGSIQIKLEFHSESPSLVGTEQTYNIKTKKKSLEFNNKNFQRLSPDRKDALSGLWVITGRANPEGNISKMTPGARRTYKMMVEGHFQWLAINIQSGEFSGTGGGKYSLKDGKYIEKIEFFSRDNSRVGAELDFNAEVNDKEWIHSGKSSKGDPIKEVWTKQ